MSVITCRSNQLLGSRPRPAGLPYSSAYHYIGGTTGEWQVTKLSSPCGVPVPSARRVDVVSGSLNGIAAGTSWILSGVVQNTRYVTREEAPASKKRTFGREPSEPTCAALMAVHRSPEWWQLGYTARWEIQQAHSRPGGLQLLSAMIRNWHGRDLSSQFDCVTWFEYEPRDSASFDDLVAVWRASEEWKFVDREFDLRLIRSL